MAAPPPMFSFKESFADQGKSWAEMVEEDELEQQNQAEQSPAPLVADATPIRQQSSMVHYQATTPSTTAKPLREQQPALDQTPTQKATPKSCWSNPRALFPTTPQRNAQTEERTIAKRKSPSPEVSPAATPKTTSAKTPESAKKPVVSFGAARSWAEASQVLKAQREAVDATRKVLQKQMDDREKQEKAKAAATTVAADEKTPKRAPKKEKAGDSPNASTSTPKVASFGSAKTWASVGRSPSPPVVAADMIPPPVAAPLPPVASMEEPEPAVELKEEASTPMREPSPSPDRSPACDAATPEAIATPPPRSPAAQSHEEPDTPTARAEVMVLSTPMPYRMTTVFNTSTSPDHAYIPRAVKPQSSAQSRAHKQTRRTLEYLEQVITSQGGAVDYNRLKTVTQWRVKHQPRCGSLFNFIKKNRDRIKYERSTVTVCVEENIAESLLNQSWGQAMPNMLCVDRE